MAHLTRRDFLNGLTVTTAAIGLGALVSCSDSSDSSDSSDPAKAASVVVVGAGLAGLTAAYELQQAGFAVTVIEAGDQPGGRVHTLRDGFVDGQHAEACGEFIDGKQVHTQMHHYVDTFDLQLQNVGVGGLTGTYYLEQQRFTFRQLQDVLGQDVVRDIGSFWEALETLAADVADPTDPAMSADAAALDQQSVAEWLDELDLDDSARTIVDHYLRGEYGEPEETSLLYLAQSSAVYADVSDSQIEVFRIEGGNDKLPAALAAALVQPPITNSPVTAVRSTGSGVVVEHFEGEAEADYLVLAAPLPTLRNVNFEPPLSPTLQAAVDEVGFATHIKTLLQYGERFWWGEELSGDTITDLPVGWIWEATENQEGDAGILVTYTSGDFGEGLAGLDPEERIDATVAQVEEIFPGSRALLVAAETPAPADGPYFYSGFTNYAPGQITEYWGALRQPHGRVLFAGEHTDVYVGYMEGAVRSGQRVAQQIAEL